ncbi:uncharacterized protein LOC122087310 isoform X2 [Macadamia integrifolia]|uniref:uncharacterized protein LOC122087310 isoform X2 n=1 Tax=Macadamia integrifolia TaxID=60698 RepID=UPI001C4F9C6D|nr:uncharacterized protein LOC122087310 isoform X2 [Macadamia integrifolia]
MVVKMMKWRPWPPVLSKKFEVKLVMRRLEGLLSMVMVDGEKLVAEVPRLLVEIKWKGTKNALSSLRRTVKRNFTKEEDVHSDGVVHWNEEFLTVCNLTAYKDNVIHPWEVSFTVINEFYEIFYVTNTEIPPVDFIWMGKENLSTKQGCSKQGQKNKVPVVGTATLNLAEFASAGEEKEIEIDIPLVQPGGGAEPHPIICISLSLLELRITQEPGEMMQRSIVPVPLSPPPGETLLTEKDEVSALKAGLRRVKILKEYVSSRRAKKAGHEEEGSEGRCSARSEDGDCVYPFDTDSLDDYDGGELEDDRLNSSFRKSFSYGTLAYTNCVGGSFYSEMRISGENEDWIYYSNRKSDVGLLKMEESMASASQQSLQQSSKRSILPWRKRKLSFRSPKSKGEPLLKKAYAEEGGDDIDFDRRQLSSSDESSQGWRKVDEDSIANRSSVSEFGDDNFAVGSWERKEVISRDGHMKLCSQVFYASIDQRNERAAGESACTALVAVIADWFQNNRDDMPIKSQFDSLIREGSLEWRNLCENETYRERFPDKHFDLETVLQAKIRPLSVAPQKSFIGFFHPDGMEEGGFDFLHGAMSFDNIWDEISYAGSNCPSNDDPQVYIVSWNDHFFVLKVEPEAYYIIDTLGERLFEGCNQAYILRFDKDTAIHRLPKEAQSEGKSAGDHQKVTAAESANRLFRQSNNTKETSAAGPIVLKPDEELKKSEGEEEVVCSGKESCKEYIKNFLAAIPLRELQLDIKKGLMASTPLHHRLQIEFHYTEFLQPTAGLEQEQELELEPKPESEPRTSPAGAEAEAVAA